MIKWISFLIVCLSSCSQETLKVSNGTLRVYLSSSENNFIYFNFLIENIYLIDKNGQMLNLGDGASYEVNFSGLDTKSEMILNISLPEENYYNIALDVNLSKAIIKNINDGEIETLNIYDDYGLKWNENKSSYRIESNINGGFPLEIRRGKVANLSIDLDIDASTRWLSIDKKSVGNVLVSPVFNVSLLPTYPNNIHWVGEIIDFNKKSMRVMPIKPNIEQLPITVPLYESASYQLNGEDYDLDDWQRLATSDKYQIGSFSGSVKNNDIQIKSINYVTGFSLYLNQGVMTKEHMFVGQQEEITKSSASVKFIEEKVGNHDAAVATTLSYASHESVLDMKSEVQWGASLTGTITESNSTELRLQPLSVNNWHSSLFFNADDEVSILTQREDFSINDQITFHGRFTDDNFQSAGADYIDARNQRIHIALPLSSGEDIFSAVTNEGFVIDKEIVEDVFYYQKLSASPTGEDVDQRVNEIIIDTAPDKLVILTKRVQPSEDIYRLLSIKDFIHVLNEQRLQGYLVNSVVADGYVDDRTFVATNIIVTLFPLVEKKASDAMLSDKLSGIQLAGPFLLVKSISSRIKKYFNSNNKTFLNPFLRTKAPKRKAPARKIEITLAGQADLSSFMNEGMDANQKLRKFTLLNPIVGDYLSVKMNAMIANSSPLESFNKSSKFVKSLTDFEPLMGLFNEKNPVFEMKNKLMLDDFIDARRGNKETRKSFLVFDDFFSDGKNKVLLDALLDDSVGESTRTHTQTINDLILRNDDSGIMKKLLINNTDVYQQVFNTYEKYLVKSEYADDESVNKKYNYTQSNPGVDTVAYYEKLQSKFQGVDGQSLDDDFKKINKVITGYVETQVSDLNQNVSDNEKMRGLKLGIKSALQSVGNDSVMKKYVSFMEVNQSVSTASDTKKFSMSETDRLSMESKSKSKSNKQSWGVSVETTKIKTLTYQIDASSSTRKPTKR